MSVWISISALSAPALLAAMATSSGGEFGHQQDKQLLRDRWYLSTQIELGSQQITLDQADRNDLIEEFDISRERYTLGMVAPQGVRLELSRWYQSRDNTTDAPIIPLDDSRGWDANLLSQYPVGPFTPYLTLGIGIFSYDEPLNINNQNEKIEGQQYNAGLGLHWLVTDWLEFNVGYRYQKQEGDGPSQDEKAAGLNYKFDSEGQTLDFGVHIVF